MGGHKSREAGKAFEKRINNALEVARQTGIVPWFRHQQPRMTMHGRFIEQAGADFVGVLSSGLMLSWECKSALDGKHAQDRIARSEFTDEQESHLLATSRCGGLSLAGLEFRDDTSGIIRSFGVPWHLVPWRRLDKLEHVFAAEIDAIWALPKVGTVARYVEKCQACEGHTPFHRYRKSCCPAVVPF